MGLVVNVKSLVTVRLARARARAGVARRAAVQCSMCMYILYVRTRNSTTWTTYRGSGYVYTHTHKYSDFVWGYNPEMLSQKLTRITLKMSDFQEYERLKEQKLKSEGETSNRSSTTPGLLEKSGRSKATPARSSTPDYNNQLHY